MIVEGIVTTQDGAGQVNFAPMGVEWGEERLVLKPFLETTTFRNLSAHGYAVFNLIDDVLLFAQAAIGSPQFPWRPAEHVRGAVLEAACSWHELEVETIDDTPPRSRIDARVVHRGRGREFIGFNRAKHAVLEAAILVDAGAHASTGTDERGTRSPRGPGRQDRRTEGARGLGPAPGLRRGTPRLAGDTGMSVPVERVRVRAPARLHFGVLDLRGMLGRRFGGMGAAVPAPALELEAERADGYFASGPDAERALGFARRYG